MISPFTNGLTFLVKGFFLGMKDEERGVRNEERRVRTVYYLLLTVDFLQSLLNGTKDLSACKALAASDPRNVRRLLRKNTHDEKRALTLRC